MFVVVFQLGAHLESQLFQITGFLEVVQMAVSLLSFHPELPHDIKATTHPKYNMMLQMVGICMVYRRDTCDKIFKSTVNHRVKWHSYG